MNRLGLGIVLLWLGSALAEAGHYQVSYEGGYVTVTNGSPSGSYRDQSGRWGYGGSGQAVSCSGAITVTFTWTGGGTPPPVAIVRESCQASAWAYSGTASAANDLGDEPVVTQTTIPPYIGKISGMDGASYRYHYWTKTDPGNSFNYTRSPTASSGNSWSGANVSYAATAHGVTMTLSGVVDPANDKRAAVGCRVGAEVNTDLPVVDLVFTWTEDSTCLPFSSYSFTNSSSSFAEWEPASSPETTVVFRDGGPVTLRCRITHPTLGIDATVEEEDLEIDEPTWQAEELTVQDRIGEFYLLPSAASATIFGLYFFVPPDTYESGKRWWQKVQDAASVLLMSPNQRSYVKNILLGCFDYAATDRTTELPVSIPGFTMNTWGLDGNAPYGAEVVTNGETILQFNDTPRMEGVGLSTLGSMRVRAEFKTYLLYEPATPYSQHVNIAMQEWEIDGRATWNTGLQRWQITTNSASDGDLEPWCFHPMWSVKVH